MAKEYIECEAAYLFAQDQLKKETGAYSRGWNHAMNVMKSALHNNDAIPVADVWPVVRCGECKYWTESSAIPLIGCCVFTPMRHTAEFFCANGERKGGDGE